MVGVKGAKQTVWDEVLAALYYSPTPLTLGEVMETTRRSQSAVRNNLSALCFTGLVVRLWRGGPYNRWRYTLAQKAVGGEDDGSAELARG